MNEKQYRRLLRWYPRGWRALHGEVMLGMMLDHADADADARGRTSPSVGERFAALQNGVGARLTMRCAIVSSLLAVLLATLAFLATTWGSSFVYEADLGWVTITLSSGLAPVLVMLGVACLARERNLLTEGRALVVLGLSTVTFALGSLALIGFGQSFEAADAGVPDTGLGATWWALLLGSWVAGSTMSALLIEPILARTRLHQGTALLASVALGALLAASVAPTLITAVTPALAGVAVAVFSLMASRPTLYTRGQQAPERQIAPMRTPARPTAARRGTVRSLAIVSAVTSIVAVVFAFTGSLWPIAASDSTIAMGQGISMALFCAVPLLAAIGLVFAPRSRQAPQHTWGPLALLVMSFGALAVAYLPAPDDWNAAAPGFATSAALTGCALAWWLATRLRGPRVIRVTIGALCGLGYAAFFGLIVAPTLAFAVPFGAIALAVWPGRSVPHVDVARATTPAFSH